MPLKYEKSSIHIASLYPGQYFSEISTLSDTSHMLSARAGTDVKLAIMNKELLDRFLDVPSFSIPLAQDLAIKFQKISNSTGMTIFDPSNGLQVEDLSHLLPESILVHYEILPLRLHGDELLVGITNPESQTIYSVISRHLQNYRVKTQLIKASDFQSWLSLVKKKKKSKEAQNLSVEKSNSHLAQSKPSDSKDTVGILNNILLEGLEKQASDIHLEPHKNTFAIRYRIDGVLIENDNKYSTEIGLELINRIKVFSKIDTTNKFTPQDGHLKIDVLDGSTCSARVSTLPTPNGESVVLRLIKEKNSVPPMTVITPDRRVINLLKEVVTCGQGVFLVTGPTGSGKTTTLYSILQELNHVGVSIISIENPIEMEIEGVTQVEVNEKVGLTFPVALKSALRQDPDIIMIGEIRDEESAKIAFHAASTGHMVLSTLHTNDSLNVIPRLIELGVSKQVLASSLIGASAQRLVRSVCQSCSEKKLINNEEERVLKKYLSPEIVPTELLYGKGCTSCLNTGYYGRIPIIELWKKTENLQRDSSLFSSHEDFLKELSHQQFETLFLASIKNGGKRAYYN